MMLLRLIVQECLGMFVDDERLALSILAVVAACGLLTWWLHASPLAIALLLVIGCACVLIASVVRGAAK